MDFAQTVALAFVGGVILNAMPCVLPVLTLKIHHTLEMVGNKENVRASAVLYTLGTWLLYAALGGVVIGAKIITGRSVQQNHLQNPLVVALVLLMVFVFALNAFGVFEIRMSTGGSVPKGALGSFVVGIFAAIMSTPCTAPYIGSAAAVAMAVETPHWQTLTLFSSAGIGLGFPYMLIAFVPALAQRIPKPGPWMETFKQMMAFTLMGATVWLYSVLLKQISADAAGSFLALLVLIAFGFWAMEKLTDLRHSGGRRWLTRILVIGLVGFLGEGLWDLSPKPHASAATLASNSSPVLPPDAESGHINWVPFSEEAVATLHKTGAGVFMDYTADWCAACKTNEKVFLETKTVRQAFLDTDLVPVKVDMTNENEVMERWLEDLGRSGIPAYAIYFPSGEVDLLPEQITADMVAERLRKAADKLKDSLSKSKSGKSQGQSKL